MKTKTLMIAGGLAAVAGAAYWWMNRDKISAEGNVAAGYVAGPPHHHHGHHGGGRGRGWGGGMYDFAMAPVVMAGSNWYLDPVTGTWVLR